MNTCPFCNLDPAPTPAASRPPTPAPSAADQLPTLLSRAWKILQWLFPTTLLLLIPKCPFCVAAYVALFTGIGITVSTARWIQILMFLFCLISLAYLAFKFLNNRRKRRPRYSPI